MKTSHKVQCSKYESSSTELHDGGELHTRFCIVRLPCATCLAIALQLEACPIHAPTRHFSIPIPSKPSNEQNLPPHSSPTPSPFYLYQTANGKSNKPRGLSPLGCPNPCSLSLHHTPIPCGRPRVTSISQGHYHVMLLVPTFSIHVIQWCPQEHVPLRAS